MSPILWHNKTNIGRCQYSSDGWSLTPQREEVDVTGWIFKTRDTVRFPQQSAMVEAYTSRLAVKGPDVFPQR